MSRVTTAAGEPPDGRPGRPHIPDELILRCQAVLATPGWGGSADPAEREMAKGILSEAAAQRTRPFRPYDPSRYT